MSSALSRRISVGLLACAVVGGLALTIFAWRSGAAAGPRQATATPAATRAATATPVPAEAPAADATDTVTATAPSTGTTGSAEESAPAESPAEAPGANALSSLTLDDLEEYNGIPVGFTDAGLPFMGDPAAPVAIVEYSDYLCPFCARHFVETMPALIDEYVLTGKLRYVFQDFPIPSLHPNAPQGHVAAHCVGEQGAAAYWAMHDQLFARQNEWNQVADPTAFLADAAEQAGADMDAFQECVDSGHTLEQVEAGMAEGAALGFNGTPTFVFSSNALPETYTLVGAYPVDSFRLWADTMFEGQAPPVEAEPEPAQLPFWASAEGLAPDPDNPGHTLAGDQMKGAEDALLTIVEFSDFQCPACALHNNEVQPTLDEEFVETGKVRWVFKHRPLGMHPFAPVAAAAAECATEQGAFWEMHDALFADVGAWAPGDDSWAMEDAEVALQGIAGELGLESDSFEECLDSRQPLERVLADIFDSEGVVSSTPTFVVLYGGQGTLISGSRPAEDFAEILNQFVQMAEEDAAAAQE